MMNLSPRQHTIVTLLADGMQASEIAAELQISTQTVKWHKTRIQRIFNARNSTHVVALAYHNGILSPARNRDVPMRLFA